MLLGLTARIISAFVHLLDYYWQPRIGVLKHAESSLVVASTPWSQSTYLMAAIASIWAGGYRRARLQTPIVARAMDAVPVVAPV